MYRDFFTNKWVLGAIVFLIVFGVACVLWYHYDTAPDNRDAAKTTKLLRQRETTQNENANNNTDGETNLSAKSNPSSTERTANDLNDIHLETNTSTEVEKKDSKEMRVSPHGFGPYPEIPTGYRAPHIFGKPLSKTQELMMRVDIKLWKQGIHTEGIRNSHKSGLVYPNVPGLVYVTWEDFRLPDGNVIRLTGRISGHPNAIESLPLRGLPGIPNCPPNFLFESDIPSHITVLEHSEGIDPYEFLKEELK